MRALGEIESYSTAIKAMVLRETLRLVESRGRADLQGVRQLRDGHVVASRRSPALWA